MNVTKWYASGVNVMTNDPTHDPPVCVVGGEPQTAMEIAKFIAKAGTHHHELMTMLWQAVGRYHADAGCETDWCFACDLRSKLERIGAKE